MTDVDAQKKIVAEMEWAARLQEPVQVWLNQLKKQLGEVNHFTLTDNTRTQITDQLSRLWPSATNPGVLGLRIQIVVASDRLILSFLDNRSGVSFSPTGQVTWTATQAEDLPILGRLALTGPLPIDAPIGGSFYELARKLTWTTPPEIDLSLGEVSESSSTT